MDNNKIYRSKVDFKILTKEIRFNFLASGTVDSPIKSTLPTRTYNKTRCLELHYDTTHLVDTIIQEDKVGNQRMFLMFDSKGIRRHSYLPLFATHNAPIVLEVFKTSKGVFGFETIKGTQFGAFLSHKNYFNTTMVEQSRSTGALRPFTTPTVGKNHTIQMILPGTKLLENTKHLTFDMDIYVETGGQYTTSLGFKISLEKMVNLEGDIVGMEIPEQIINEPTNITLETSYIKLNQSDLASREMLYDYKKQLIPQNFNADALELIDSNVFTITNNIVATTDLSSLNLAPVNIIELPYNISRNIIGGKVQKSKKILHKGKEIYPLNWVNELRENKIFSSSNKCMSLRFTSKAQLESFTDKLKQQQIGKIEQYPTINTQGTVSLVDRNYSKLSQWLERSNLHVFNDVTFSYESDGDLSSILVCPNKRTRVNEKNISKENCLSTLGGEYVLPSGGRYVGDFHVTSKSQVVTGKDANTKNQQLLTQLYQYAPIDKDSSSDFLFTTYSNKPNEVYSAVTATNLLYEENKTYDLHLSATSFSASTTTIPITNIQRETLLPLIDDVSKDYAPYAFPNVYIKNGGNLRINTDTPNNYASYSADTSGVFRFTYKSYLQISYTDEKWCYYLDRTYPTSMGDYPSTDYEIKRLINTSIIKAGQDETNTVVQDTGFKYHPGYRYKEGDSVSDMPNNTGIIDFDFTVSIVKTDASGNNQTVLSEFKVLRSEEDGDAQAYLTLDVTKNDMFIKGGNSCILSGASASTIFTNQIPVSVDTGFINLTSGETVTLIYNSNWETITKGGSYGLGGNTNIDINLGHELDVEGNKLTAPWFRGIKSAEALVPKNLFFDAGKSSKPFNMKVGNTTRPTTLPGVLYISDKDCGNIQVPTVNAKTFRSLRFTDSSGPHDRLVWDVVPNNPTNNWQKLIENNTIKDYTLNNSSKLTAMKNNGIFCFYLPTYNNDYGPNCDYKFPQLSQSYIILNKFRNFFGGVLEHYIVVTPECGFFKPCSGAKLLSAYDIIHKTKPEDWKLVNIDKKIRINGRDISIVSDTSHANPAPTRLPNQIGCEYYCQCSSLVAEELELDTIFSTSNVFKDLTIEKCGNCIEKAKKYCQSLNSSCRPVIVGNCKQEATNWDLTSEEEVNTLTTNKTKKINYKGLIKTNIVKSNTGEPPIDRPPSSDNLTLYGCFNGECFLSVDGVYSSLDVCKAACKPTYASNSSVVIDEKRKKVNKVTEKQQICNKGEYWCASQGMCLSNKLPCLAKIIS
tara:strand:+ start:16171 stop:19926 length:3756 start_codon:yes stop_codon:yes gene_type:complete